MSKNVIRTALAWMSIPMLLACSLFVPTSPPDQAEIEKEEQLVYSFFVSEAGGPVLILQDTAIDVSTDDPQEVKDYIKSDFPKLSKETLNSFLERNQQPSQLSPEMQLGVEYTLLSADDLATISHEPNWNEILNDRYPGSRGYLIFSRVGFNHSLDQAVLYVAQVAGPLMGSGSYYLMEKSNGTWSIKDQAMAWIS